MSTWVIASSCVVTLVNTATVVHAAESPINENRTPPNVVVFIADDVGWNDYGCYGNEHARTPHIDALAEAGIRYSQAFLTASSCSPSRASIITGRYPHNNGRAAELHLPIASNIPWFPEVLRQGGYYTALAGKNHMKVDATLGNGKREPAFDVTDPGRSKDNSGGHASWVSITRERPRDRPFFFWFAAYDAHRGWDADRQWNAEQFGEPHSPENVVVPPFLVDDDDTRSDLASYYNEVTRFDHFIGLVVEELRDQQVLDNTLILVLADNGRPFPRAKTRLHDSGMKTALIAHWPAGIQQTGVHDGLVSVIDIAPTVLQVAGCEIPDSVQGVSMSPTFESLTAPVRSFAFSEHNWHDYEAHGRSVRDGKYLYIRNSRPYLPWQGPADSVRSPSHRSLLKQLATSKLSPAQQDVFLEPRPLEELYLVADDADQRRNLAGEPTHENELKRLRKTLDRWIADTGDSVPEKISGDYFDRESGDQLPIKNHAYRGTTPGFDREAWNINAAGPR